MKKVLAIMLVCFMLVSLLPMGALAEEVKTTCPGKGNDHYLSNCDNEFVNHVPGTCGGYSYDVYKCLGCGDHFAADFVKIDGEHAWDDSKHVDATCETAGKDVCSICGFEKPIDALGHTEGDPEGDCENGYTTKCTVCGKEITKLPGEHNFGGKPSSIEKEPTKTENGLAIYTCILCGYEKEVVILYHICEENLVDVEGKAPGCLTDGYTAHQKCTVCDETFGKEVLPAFGAHTEPETTVVTENIDCTMYWNSAWYVPEATIEVTFNVPEDITTTSTYYDAYFRICVGYEWSGTWYDDYDLAYLHAGESVTVTFEAGQHYRVRSGCVGTVSYTYAQGVSIVEGDCTTNSVKKYICAVCGEKVEEELGVNHTDFVVEHEVAAGCETYGYTIVSCVACGYYHVDVEAPLGHTTYEEALELGIVSDWYATCINEYEVSWYCVRCDEELTKTLPALDHDIAHYSSKPTCNAYGYYFDFCKNEIKTYSGSATKHAYVNAATNEIIKYDYATVLGKDAGYAEGTYYYDKVVYVKSVDTITVKEGNKDVTYPVVWVIAEYNSDAHNPGDKYAPIVMAPTCTEEGLEIYWCMDCEKDIVITTPATGHTPGEVQTKAPTCNEPGSIYQLCEVCGEIVAAEPIEFNSEYVYMTYEAAAFAHDLAGVQPEIYKEGVCGVSYQLDRYTCATCGQYILVKNTDLEHHVMPGDLMHKDHPDNVVEMPVADPIVLTGTFASAKEAYDGHYPGFYAPFDCIIHVTKNHSSLQTGGISEGRQYSAGEYVSANVWCSETWFENGEITGYEIVVTFEATSIRQKQYAAQDATCTADGWTAQYYCERCDELVKSTTIKALGHSYTTATCTELATCTTCGETTGDYAHKWNAATCTTAKTCELCALTEGEALGHNHVLTDSAKLIEGKQYGYEHYECDRCHAEDAEYIINYVNYHVHTFNNRPVKTQATTCTTLGYKQYKCLTCDYVETRYNEEDLLPHVNAAGQDLTVCHEKITDFKCVNGCKATFEAVAHEVGYTYYVANCQTSEYYAENCANCAYYVIHDGECGTKNCELCAVVDPALGEHVTESNLVWNDDHTVLLGQYTACKIDGCDYYVLENVDAVTYTATIDNALVAGAAITDGSLVKVTISMTGSEDYVWGFQMNIPYSENMTFVKAEFVSKNFVINTAHDNGGYITVVANAEDNAFINTTEAIVELYFTVTAPEATELSVGFDFVKTLAADENGKAVVVESFAVAATAETIVLMELDGDTEVTLADAMILYYMINVDYSAAADLDKDGEITLSDFMALYYYLSGAMTYEEIVALQ